LLARSMHSLSEASMSVKTLSATVAAAQNHLGNDDCKRLLKICSSCCLSNEKEQQGVFKSRLG